MPLDALSAVPEELLRELETLRTALRESETRFRDVIERNADAIVVIDDTGVIRFANEEAAKLFDTTAAQLTATPFGFPLVAGNTTELDLVRGTEPIIVEMRVVESHWEGAPAFIATLRNITARKIEEQHARELVREQAARQSAEAAAGKFRFLAESTVLLSSSLDNSRIFSDLGRLCVDEIADWAVIFTHEDGQFRRVHVAHCDDAKAELARKLTGTSVASDVAPIAELLRSRAPQLIRNVDDVKLKAFIPDPATRDLICSLGIGSFLLVPMIARGRVLGAISLVSVSPDGFGRGDVELVKDLASRAALAIDNARLYEDARRANQSKTELLAIISHDLRTPLNSIIGFGELLRMGIPETLSDGVNEKIDRILSAAHHQLYLIDELLHFARLDAQHETIECRDIDAREILRDCAALIEPVAQQKGLRVETRLPEALRITTDPDKLRQVVINLLGNAVKYTLHGSILLAASAGGDDIIRIRVTDSGIGIAQQDLPHVFEPFWQADRAQRTRGGGTGLGLAVVRQIVELLGGRVAVQSVLGEGSTFEIFLPLESARAGDLAGASRNGGNA